MAKTIAIVNQKGGVGKTTTTLNLGAALKKRGYRVLFVDMDSQGSLGYALGYDGGGATVMEVLLGQTDVQSAIVHTGEGDLLPASPELSGMDMTLTQTGKEYRLKEGLEPVRDSYDYIIADSPPTLGILTVNILTAADYMIIPALADVFSIMGIGQLYSTIRAVTTYCNKELNLAGILLVRHNERYILSREMREMLQSTAEQLGTQVYQTTIREAVPLRESQAVRKSIFAYAPRCKQAGDYDRFAEEFISGIMSREGAQHGQP